MSDDWNWCPDCGEPREICLSLGQCPTGKTAKAIQTASKLKHTDGPWYVGEDDALDCPDHANSGLALVDTGRSNDWPIARLCEWNNAYLIAAAPDLLDALKAMLSEFEPGQLPDAEEAYAPQQLKAIEMARAAIEKAENK